MKQAMLLNPNKYPFLNELKKNFVHIKKEYIAYINDPKVDHEILAHILKAKSSVIKPGKLDDKHQIYPFYLHRKKLIEIIKDYSLTFENLSLEQIEDALAYIESQHFKITQQIIEKLYNNDKNGILDVYFSVIAPHVHVKLHINNDPYLHRAYLGIIVPEGDIAMKINGEIIKWIEGDFIVLDVTHPHCPHNNTDQCRVALNIDFYRPEAPRDEMEHLAKAQFTKRMNDNPYGYGLYGTDDAVDKHTLNRFGEFGEKIL